MEKLEEVKIRTFKDLNDEIIDKDLCCSCGACVSYCEVQEFNVIEMKGYTPVFKSEKTEENPYFRLFKIMDENTKRTIRECQLTQLNSLDIVYHDGKFYYEGDISNFQQA